VVFLLVLYKKGIQDTYPYTSQIPPSLYPSPPYDKHMVGFFFILPVKYEKTILIFPNRIIIGAPMKHTDYATRHDASPTTRTIYTICVKYLHLIYARHPGSITLPPRKPASSLLQYPPYMCRNITYRE